jgi:hypothetical protein
MTVGHEDGERMHGWTFDDELTGDLGVVAGGTGVGNESGGSNGRGGGC